MKKNTLRALIVSAMAIFGIGSASAQYAQIANQLTNLISPALSGSTSYKGFVELSGLAGFGANRANFVGVSTSQGFRYRSWFFMGAGVGVDVVRSYVSDDLASLGPDEPAWRRDGSRTKAMIPVFSDFRFMFGPSDGVNFYADIKLGAAWLIGGSYLVLDNGYMSTQTQFYLKPSLGVRIPVSSGDTKHAFNIGITYQLLTSNNNWGYNRYSANLNNIGVTVGYEW